MPASSEPHLLREDFDEAVLDLEVETGYVHRMVAVQKWGCPAEVLYVYHWGRKQYLTNSEQI